MNTILTIMQWIKVNVRVLFVLTLVCGVVLYTLELWTEGGLRFRASQPASTRDFHPPAANSLRFIPQHRLPDAKRSRNNSVVVHIPAMVHQTLKQKAQKGSTDQTRWSTQCQQVNSALDFYLYDDEELANFVRNHYLQYNSLYQSLSGIYMADMARFVLMYHFGGIYMDRDFYCSRPLVCLSDAVIGLIQRELSPPSKGPQTHLLIASREPLLHAVFIHNHPRTVIQDFFLATPHHPFFKWLLDLINADFIRRQLPTNASSSSSKITISEKGPFSYSIEHYLDLYYKEKNMQVKHQRQNGSLLAHRWMHDQSSPGLEVIYEMHSRILHPLLDSSNQRLHTRCHQFAKKDAQLQDAEPLIKESCQLLRRGQALTTSPETAMAHMWTHSYLMFSFLRSWYHTSIYDFVERKLPPSRECAAVTTDSSLFSL